MAGAKISGAEDIGLFWIAILVFLRIATSRRYESSPMTTEESASIVTGWVGFPNVVLVSYGAALAS